MESNAASKRAKNTFNNHSKQVITFNGTYFVRSNYVYPDFRSLATVESFYDF